MPQFSTCSTRSVLDHVDFVMEASHHSNSENCKASLQNFQSEFSKRVNGARPASTSAPRRRKATASGPASRAGASGRPLGLKPLLVKMRVEGKRSVAPVAPHHLEADAIGEAQAALSGGKHVVHRLGVNGFRNPLHRTHREYPQIAELPSAGQQASCFSSSRSKTACKAEVSRSTVTSALRRPGMLQQHGGRARRTYRGIPSHTVR